MCEFVFPSVLRACAGFGDPGIGWEVHSRIIKSGFYNDPVTQASLLCMYGEIGCLVDANKVFDEMTIRDVVSWSTIISCYVDKGETTEALETFRLMLREGVEPDSVSMLSVGEACGELGCLKLGRSVHGQIMTRRIENDESLANSLAVMYSKCGDLFSAERIFIDIACRSITCWTGMISCYNRGGCFEKALDAFFQMLNSKFELNSVTLTSVLSSCAMLSRIRDGKLLHCYAIRRNMDPEYEYLGPALIQLYSQCGRLDNCEKVLCTIGVRNIVSWNSLISIYAQKGLLKEALIVFVQMQKQGLIPDSFSLASSLSACAKAVLLNLGHQIQGHIIKRGIVDEFVQNSLVDMYCKCGFVDSAYMIFNNIQNKKVVAWNSIICGFSQNGNSVEAIKLFEQMYFNCLDMNEVTFLCVIQACSNLGYLERGKWLHHKLITYGVRQDLYTNTALIDMYAKCGDLQTAKRVFYSMSERSVVSWSTMIAGYGVHGQIEAAVSLFTQMVQSGMRPNEVTFMNILSACTHSGSVEEGKLYFNSMKDFGIEPNSEHYACMVDLLSRAGNLNEAYRTIKSMPFQAHASIWGALVNGCRIHGRMDMIKVIEKDLLDIITDDTGFYVLLSNLYAEEGKWYESGNVRSTMERTGLKKVVGYSTIELDKKFYTFRAGDTSNLQTKGTISLVENFQNLAWEQGFEFLESDNYLTDMLLFSKEINVESNKDLMVSIE